LTFERLNRSSASLLRHQLGTPMGSTLDVFFLLGFFRNSLTVGSIRSCNNRSSLNK
jgi:hypothetical protein